MSTADDLTLLVDDLAGHWTDYALAILKAAGIRRVSVEMEFAAWRALKKVLRSELRWLQPLAFASLAALSTLKGQVLRRATGLVARDFEPEAVTVDFKSRVRRLAGEQRATAAERRVYEEIADQPVLAGWMHFAHNGEIRPAVVDRATVPAL